MATQLSAKTREKLGSGFSGRLRKLDALPAILYGKGLTNKPLEVNYRAVEKILKTRLGKNTLIDLAVEGDKNYTVLIKEYQGNALSRRLTHVDFWQVDSNQEVEIYIETKIFGKAPGLMQGGVLEHITHSVRLTCKAGSIPEEIKVDVSGLELNKNIHLADLTLPEGVKRNPNYNPTIVAVVEEKYEETAGNAAAAEGAAAPAAEGAAAPAGDAKAADAKAGDAKAAEKKK